MRAHALEQRWGEIRREYGVAHNARQQVGHFRARECFDLDALLRSALGQLAPPAIQRSGTCGGDEQHGRGLEHVEERGNHLGTLATALVEIIEGEDYRASRRAFPEAARHRLVQRLGRRVGVAVVEERREGRVSIGIEIQAVAQGMP